RGCSAPGVRGRGRRLAQPGACGEHPPCERRSPHWRRTRKLVDVRAREATAGTFDTRDASRTARSCHARRADRLWAASRLTAFADPESIQQREDHWVVAYLVGKGGHVRTVPIPSWVKVAIDGWTAAAAIAHGRVFRAVNKIGRVWGDGMSPRVVWDVVR